MKQIGQAYARLLVHSQRWEKGREMWEEGGRERKGRGRKWWVIGGRERERVEHRERRKKRKRNMNDLIKIMWGSSQQGIHVSKHFLMRFQDYAMREEEIGVYTLGYPG